jgi:hypothetical protein
LTDGRRPDMTRYQLNELPANRAAFTRTGTGFAGAKTDPVPEMLPC